MLLVNRTGPPGAMQEIEHQIAELDVTRLPDVPQDDRIEEAGARGESVFSLPQSNPAFTAVGRIVQQLQATLS